MLKEKIKNLIFLIFMPIACFLLVGIFSFSNVIVLTASAVDNGGAFYIGNSSIFTLGTDKSISGFSAELNGGGFYVNSGGTLNIEGGVIYQNKTTSQNMGNGGGVYVGDGGTLNLEKGVISNNNSYSGAGVYNAGTFNMNGGVVSENSGRYGGSVYNSGTFTMTGGNISENIGGVYNAGTFVLEGGIISQNASSSASDMSDVYVNTGSTFIMNGGTIEDSKESCSCLYVYSANATINDGLIVSTNGYAIQFSYNQNSNINGGTIKGIINLDNSKLTLSKNATIIGSINFDSSSSEIVLKDYDGTTPEYNITLDSSFTTGTIMTFVGSSTEPDISKINVSGYDTSKYEIVAVKDSDGNWTISLVQVVFDFPSTWKTEIASTDNMTTTVSYSNIKSIQFISTVPSGYTKIGTLSTGLPVYKGTTSTDIAFVGKKIYAPEDSSKLLAELYGVTSINFETFDTSKVTDMNHMFYACSSTGLTSLDLSNFDTSKVTNMSGMFYYCDGGLKKLNLSSFDTSNVTNMSSMFFGDWLLDNLDLSNFNTSNVTDMGYMFYQVDLTNTNLSNFDTSNVINMSGVFMNCSRLTSLDLSNFNTSNVTNMSYMFYYCSSLKSLDLSNFDTSNVTNMSSMFSGDSYLDYLDLCNFNTSNVTDMSYMFNDCSGMGDLGIERFNTSKVTNMSCMFYDCIGLESLDISSFNMSKVTNFSDMLSFGSDNQIQILKTPYNNSSELSITTGSTLYNAETGAVVTSVPAGTTKSLIYVSSIQEFPSTWKSEIESTDYMTTAISSVDNLTSIAFVATNPGYTQIGTLSTGLPVYADSGLTNIAFVAGKIYAPENSGDLFSSLYEVTSIVFDTFDTSRVTNMSSMFNYCDNLGDLDLRNFDTSKVTNMSYMFNSCGYYSGSGSYDLSSFNMANVTNCSSMFNFQHEIRLLKTPYNNSSAIAITTETTLYRSDTGAVVTSVPANLSASITLTSTKPSSFLSKTNDIFIVDHQIESCRENDVIFEKSKEEFQFEIIKVEG